jgi:glycosyltransferase involved in cell wall biosynthesis
MRVLAVTNMYPTAREPWFGCFVAEQVEALRARGVDVDVLAFDGRRHKGAYGAAALRLRKAVRRKRYDIVHAHYGLAGAVAISQRRAPVVTTFWGSDTGYVNWQRHVSRVVARWSTPVFVSAANREQLGVDGVVIGSPADLVLFQSVPREEARESLGWASARYALFAGGSTNLRKRPELFAAAVNCAQVAVPDLRPAYLEGLTRAQSAAAMNAADVVVLTSDWEGSPLAVKEALACGTPVVSVDVGDVPEVIQDLPGCRIVGRTVGSVASAIVGALGRDPDREALRRRAEMYSPERVTDALLRVYEMAGA